MNPHSKCFYFKSCLSTWICNWGEGYMWLYIHAWGYMWLYIHACTCVCTHGCDPFWSPNYLYSPSTPLSPPYLLHTHQHIKRPRSASWHSSFKQGLERILSSQRLVPEKQVLNQMDGDSNISQAVALIFFLSRAKMWALGGQASSCWCWLTVCRSHLPQGHFLGGLLCLGDPCPQAPLPDGGTLGVCSYACSFLYLEK